MARPKSFIRQELEKAGVVRTKAEYRLFKDTAAAGRAIDTMKDYPGWGEIDFINNRSLPSERVTKTLWVEVSRWLKRFPPDVVHELLGPIVKQVASGEATVMQAVAHLRRARLQLPPVS